MFEAMSLGQQVPVPGTVMILPQQPALLKRHENMEWLHPAQTPHPPNKDAPLVTINHPLLEVQAVFRAKPISQSDMCVRDAIHQVRSHSTTK